MGLAENMNYDEWTVDFRDGRGLKDSWRCYAVSETDATAQFRNCNPSKITEGAEVIGARKSGVAHG